MIWLRPDPLAFTAIDAHRIGVAWLKRSGWAPVYVTAEGVTLTLRDPVGGKVEHITGARILQRDRDVVARRVALGCGCGSAARHAARCRFAPNGRGWGYGSAPGRGPRGAA